MYIYIYIYIYIYTRREGKRMAPAGLRPPPQNIGKGRLYYLLGAAAMALDNLSLCRMTEALFVKEHPPPPPRGSGHWLPGGVNKQSVLQKGQKYP